jgi:hypothetical protein
MDRLIDLSGKAVFLKKSLSLSPEQHQFIQKIMSAGFFAKLYYQKVERARKYTRAYQVGLADRCLREADDAKNDAVSNFNRAIRFFISMSGRKEWSLE